MKLFATLRALFSRTPAPAPTPVKARSAALNVHDHILARTAATPVRREYKLPELPPGVVPATLPTEATGLKLAMDGPYKEPERLALDSGAVGGSSVFQWANTLSVLGCGVGFQGYPYYAELLQLSEYSIPVAMLAEEMTRKWVKLTTKGDAPASTEDDEDAAEQRAGAADAELDDEDDSDTEADQVEADAMTAKLAQITQALEDFKVRELFQTMAKYDGGFGRGQIYVGIKGQDSDEKKQLPLLIADEGVEKGGLEKLVAIEPIWTTPYSYNADDPTREDFYQPQSWYIMGRKVHRSRLLTFVSCPLPDILKPAYNFSGIGMVQLMEPYVNQWLRTRNDVSAVLHSFSTMVLLTNLQATLAESASPQAAASTLLSRATLFTNNRDNQGLMIADKNSEDVKNITTPLSGLSELQAQAQEHMAAPNQAPLIKMFGIVPSGLNATSEGEFQAWYDRVKSRQENFFGPNFKIVLELIQLHLFGSIDDSITYEWVPLDEPTVKEEAEIRKADAERDTALINAGVVDADEVREKLRSDPNSGYDHLTGDAPGMPTDPNMIDPETGESRSPALDPNKQDDDPAPAFGGK